MLLFRSTGKIGTIIVDMYTFIFLLVIVLWLMIATLQEVVGPLHPWHHLGAPRDRAALLRELLKVQQGIRFVYWLYGAIAVAEVARYFTVSTLPMLSLVLFIIGGAVLGQVIARQNMMQEWLISSLQNVQQKRKALFSSILSFFRVFEGASRQLFPVVAVARDKEELARLVEHQHHAHQTLSTAQKQQFDRVLELDSRSIESKVIPLKKALMIKASETVGPLLLSDLHQDGHDAFLVYETKRSQPSGLLERSVAVSQAGRKRSVSVAQLASEQLVYMTPSTNWQQALETFIGTSAPLSVIIDDEKQPVGVLHAQDLLRELFEKTS
jgi:CBS domain containing-hemolysin-like protein